MSSIPKKTQLPIAINENSPIDLSCQHVTTSDFMQYCVSLAMEAVPGATYNIGLETFSRLEPMSVPTFGRAEIRHKAFFVPWRTVFPAFNSFINDTPHTYEDGTVSIVHSMPTFAVSELILCLRQNVFATVSSGPGDFTFVGSSGTPSTYKFTNLGRIVYKLLVSLGYKITFDHRAFGYLSAGPLLCAARVYLDWYYTSQYANDSDSAFIKGLFTKDYKPTDTIFTSAVLQRLLSILAVVFYDTDKFTAVWDNPSGPNDGLYSDVSISDPTLNNTSSVDNNNVSGTPSIAGSLSQWGLNMLKRLTDYMKRNQISGSRVLDRYLSRFGVRLPDANINRSVLLGGFDQQLQFGDVTSTAKTEGASLGDYAGKGISYGQGGFKFSSDEYGMIIVISTIVPYTSYYQGMHRHCMHLSKFDFWTPEFDNVGVQAVSKKEVYTPLDSSSIPDSEGVGQGDSIFGFTPRYSEYKVPFDVISGDYFLRSMNVGKDSWTLFRDLNLIVQDVNYADLVHDYNFVKGVDASQYVRIFNNNNDNADHFNMIHNFTIKVQFPGRSLWDTYEFDDEDESRKVGVNVNGTTVN